VEEFQADLCVSTDLAAACTGIDAVIHLAARLSGDDAAIVSTAVEGTRRLLDAMEQAGVRRLALASSLSVYDWNAAQGWLDETAPLEPHPEARDGYTTAKLRQEQLARERCQASGIALTVLRPGVLWGPGREYPPTIGQSAGPFHLLFGAARQLPLVHVENCGDAFAAALGDREEAGGTYDVIDHPDVTVSRFARDHVRRSGHGGMVVPVPYGLAMAIVASVYQLAPAPLRRRLPAFMAPARFMARYKAVRISGEKFRTALSWRPPLTYEQCLERTYASPVP
jgi:UDP-glucose 4-epimerase